MFSRNIVYILSKKNSTHVPHRKTEKGYSVQPDKVILIHVSDGGLQWNFGIIGPWVGSFLDDTNLSFTIYDEQI